MTRNEYEVLTGKSAAATAGRAHPVHPAGVRQLWPCDSTTSDLP
jgi:hypothetical protein